MKNGQDIEEEKFDGGINKMNEKFYEELKEKVKPYFKEVGSHDFNHTLRVFNSAIAIAKSEKKVDLDIVKTAALLHDVVKCKEEDEEIRCHCKEGAKFAEKILLEMNFPKEKIEGVKYAVEIHGSKHVKPKTKEAMILQDADKLDALGAIDVTRVILSCLDKKYKRPVYSGNKKSRDKFLSAINYLLYKIDNYHPKSFHTKKGKEFAKKRHDFSKLYVETFIKEWGGEI